MQCSQNAVWCFGNTPWMLSGDFLIAWGAKWGPLMRRQPWRFVTSWFIHESFMHVLSNMLLFLVVACQVRALDASSASLLLGPDSLKLTSAWVCIGLPRIVPARVDERQRAQRMHC